MVRALHAAAPVVNYLTDPASRAQVVRYIAKRVRRSEDLVRLALDGDSLGRFQRGGRTRERTYGRTLN
jgi:hypothetical protein